MANDVFANGREIACKKADGKSICAFPDVCMTPPESPATPAGVPVPYPNTGYAKDTTKGSKTVKISGKEVMLKNKSYFKKSTGDEAGRAAKKGVVTGVNRGKVYFNSWSMNVKIEGKNVVRHLDLTTHNHASPPGQTPPQPYIDSEDVERYSRKARNKARRMNCDQLLEKINELTDHEKTGRSGPKGLIQRFRDYVGDDTTHGLQILDQQRALKTYLEAYRDRCGPPPPVSVEIAERKGSWNSAANASREMLKTGAIVSLGAGLAYLTYRTIRMLPSLLPPLWPTIPVNLAMP